MPRDIQLVGPAYADESLTFSAQDTVNWIPVADESGMARSPIQLRGLPGYSDLQIIVTDLLLQGTLPVATNGTAYSYDFVVSGGTEPYTFIYTGLPPGITGADETISGTPTVSGRYTVTVIVRDDEGAEASLTLSLFIADASGTVPDSGSPPSGGSGGTSSPTQLCLLPNSDFEDGNVSWAVVSRTPSVSPGYTIENSPGYDGSAWVARWEGRTDDGGAAEDLFQNAKSIWVVSGGSEYAFTVHLRCTAIDPGARALAGLTLRVYSDFARTTLINTVDGGRSVFTATGDWRQMRVSSNLGPYVSVCLAVSCEDGDTTIEFDQVETTAREFITGFTPAPLTNGGFESGNTGWTVLNNGPDDNFQIVNEPGRTGAWMLRWTCTDTAPENGSFIQNDKIARNSSGIAISGKIRVRCTSYGGTPGNPYEEGSAFISWFVYNDRECTDLYASGPFYSIRFSGTTGWITDIRNSYRAAGKFYKFGIGCGANVPITLEFDDCEWNATDTTPV